MQRSSVLLPEPDLPMMATTSPRPISDRDAFQHLDRAEALAHVLNANERHCVAFPAVCVPGEREAEREVDQRDQRVDEERAEGRVVQHRAGLGQVDEADDGGERRALDHLHREADRRRDGDAQRLRQDHVAHLLDIGEGERFAGFPLALRQRFDAAAPDLGEERAGPERQRQRSGQPRADLDAEQRDAEEEQEQLHQAAACPGRTRCSSAWRFPATGFSRRGRTAAQGRRCRRRRRRRATAGPSSASPAAGSTGSPRS